MATEITMAVVIPVSAPAPKPTPTPAPSTCLGTVNGVQTEPDCRDSAATYRVLGIVDRIGERFDPSEVCSAWPKATGALWREYSWSEIGTAASGLGKVFCVVKQ